MTSLESLKQLNKLKESAIRNGGYDKHRTKLEKAIKQHLDLFGEDYTPFQWTPAGIEKERLRAERKKTYNY